MLSGRSVVPVVSIIEAAYGKRQDWPEPWTALPAAAPSIARSSRPRVLVTGAGGFLGGRTTEILLQSGRWDVRALVRRPGSAARLARWPLDIRVGDITHRADVDEAIRGCDAVVHCAVGTGWPPKAVFTSTVEGTRVMAEAARAAGLRRFVHVSSMAVHGDRVPARLDETVPLHEGDGHGYGRAKYLAEQAVRTESGRGLRAIVLRPARIYGPFSRTFTTRPLAALSRGALVLAGDASTPANMVYVDNVVAAIVSALEADERADGGAFLINEPDQLSWHDYFQSFADAIGVAVRVAPYPDAGEERGGWLRTWSDGAKAIAFSPELRAMVKKVMWTDPYGALPRRLWEGFPGVQGRILNAMGVDQAVVYREPGSAPVDEVVFTIDPTLVVSDKAARELGFAPYLTGEAARALTLEWARHSRLL